jgi:hypothetical protein
MLPSTLGRNALVDKRRNWSWITALGSSAPVAGHILFEVVADEGGGQARLPTCGIIATLDDSFHLAIVRR